MTQNIGKICGCQNCKKAGVASEPMRRVPGGPNGEAIWIHGAELRKWLDARQAAREAWKTTGAKLELDPGKIRRALERRRS